MLVRRTIREGLRALARRMRSVFAAPAERPVRTDEPEPDGRGAATARPCTPVASIETGPAWHTVTVVDLDP